MVLKMLLQNLKKLQKKDKIIGIGVDIISKSRIKKSIKKESFIKRIFSKYEINISKKIKNKVSYFSKRFAAKEAFVKAIGTGFRYNVNFKDITVINDKIGKPKIKISNNLKKLIFNKYKIKKLELFISLSDEKNYSIAFVVFKKND